MSRNPGSLRAGSNGSGGYTNGYYGADDDYPRRPSAERRRRPGGYGGFSPSDRSEEAPHVQRPTSLERTQARRRSGERRQGDGAGGRFGPGSQRMEEVLRYIQQNWDFMTDERCVPIEVALKLMDSSSLGLADQYDRFQNAHQELQRALKAIVNGM